MSDNAHTRRATQLLVNYFALLAHKTGVNWDRDNYVEIGEVVEEIVEASVEAMADNVKTLLRTYHGSVVEQLQIIIKEQKALNDAMKANHEAIVEEVARLEAER